MCCCHNPCRWYVSRYLYICIKELRQAGGHVVAQSKAHVHAPLYVSVVSSINIITRRHQCKEAPPQMPRYVLLLEAARGATTHPQTRTTVAQLQQKINNSAESRVFCLSAGMGVSESRGAVQRQPYSKYTESAACISWPQQIARQRRPINLRLCRCCYLCVCVTLPLHTAAPTLQHTRTSSPSHANTQTRTHEKNPTETCC